MTIITTALVVSAWFAALVFVGRFALTRWYARAAGIITVSFLLSVLSILSLAVLTQMLGQGFTGRVPLRLAVYLLVNLMLWNGVRLLVRDQRRAKLAKDR